MKLFRRDTDTDTAPQPAPAGGCAELAADVVEPRPSTDGVCADCQALGEDVWAHLRMCLTCGHVACCDSSPHAHATHHHRETGHPVMRSAEPGEAWRWCYLHSLVG